jgi:hypothetical protein
LVTYETSDVDFSLDVFKVLLDIAADSTATLAINALTDFAVPLLGLDATALGLDATAVADVADFKAVLQNLLSFGKDMLKPDADKPDQQVTAALNAAESQIETETLLAKVRSDIATISNPVIRQEWLDKVDAFKGPLDFVKNVIQTLYKEWSDLKDLWNKRNDAYNAFISADQQLCSAAQANENCRVQQCNLPPTPPTPMPPPPGPGQTQIGVTAVQSLDPNDKIGSHGAGPQQYISGATPLRYAVYFGNQDNATAPAQQVVITDQLDLTHDDLTTFGFGPIAFGSQLISPPPLQSHFSTTVDLRPSNNLLVAVTANLNSSTGLLMWKFTSLDPTTNQPPTDPTAGFLPPGGTGSVVFTVMPKQGLPTNTQIQNQATIVFDVNPPINTPLWVNTLDNDRPTSHVSPLPAVENSASFTVQWAGTDVGSGVSDFIIFVSDNGNPFTAWQTTTAMSAVYPGVAGHTYGFFSQARDLAGNVEALKTQAEATTQVVAAPTPSVITISTNLAILSTPNGTQVQVSGTITDSASGAITATYAVTGASGQVQQQGSVPVGADGSYAVSSPLQPGQQYTITVQAHDNVGNQASASVAVGL